MSNFANKEALEKWLVDEKGVTANKASTAAATLFAKGYDSPLSLLGITIQELKDYAQIEGPVARESSNALGRQQEQDQQTRFRRLAESAAINIKDAVMKSVLFHFASQLSVVNTPEQAADLYRRASRIPRSATEIKLQEENISVAEIFGGTDTAKSIILEAFESGRPCLLKITDKESIRHEMSVWEAIVEMEKGSDHHLVPIRKLEFTSAMAQVGNMAGGYTDAGEFRAGILMKKFQSTFSRCKIPLTEDVLLRFGRQLITAISALHECGYCHMDIKPANVFLWEEDCFLGDYGGATRIGEQVREYTLSYYPSDAGVYAKKETDFMLLAVTLLEMFGSVSSPPPGLSAEEIKSKVASLENENVDSTNFENGLAFFKCDPS